MSKLNLSLPWKMFFSSGCLLGLFLVYNNLSDYPNLRWVEIAACVYASLFVIYFFIRLFDQLIIDETGFRFRSLGILYSGYWSDVIKIANQGIQEGVYIPKVSLSSGNNWYTPQDLFVPLSLFIPKWQESTLGRKISEKMLQHNSRAVEH